MTFDPEYYLHLCAVIVAAKELGCTLEKDENDFVVISHHGFYNNFLWCQGKSLASLKEFWHEWSLFKYSERFDNGSAGH